MVNRFYLTRFEGYDAIVVTWTSAEAAALAAMFTPDYLPSQWYEYRHDVASYIPLVTGGRRGRVARPNRNNPPRTRIFGAKPISFGDVTVLLTFRVILLCLIGLLAGCGRTGGSAPDLPIGTSGTQSVITQPATLQKRAKKGQSPWQVFSLATGGYTPQSVVGLAQASKSSLWFSDYNANVIGQITTKGAVAILSGVAQQGPFGLQSLAGSAYYVNSGYGYGIASGGSAVPYSLVCQASCTIPYLSEEISLDLAVTSDGSAWTSAYEIVDRYGDVLPVILRAANGIVTGVFVAPGYVASLALGPDGAVWFTDTTNTALGRIDSTGAITEISLAAFFGGGNGYLATLTTGPDGNLWVATESPTCGLPQDYGWHCILRVTPQGQITGFNTLFDASYNNELAGGRDGGIWSSANGIFGPLQRTDTSGNLSFYFNPSATSGGGAVSVGPDNSIWAVNGSSVYGYPSKRIISAKPAQLISTKNGTTKIKVSEPTYSGDFSASVVYEEGTCALETVGPAKAFNIRYDSGSTCIYAFEDQDDIGEVYVDVLPQAARRVQSHVRAVTSHPAASQPSPRNVFVTSAGARTP